MRLILTLRHWQIFLLLWAFDFSIVGLLTLTQFDLPEILWNFIFGWIPLTVYPLLLGLGLHKHVVPAGEKTDRDFKTFIIFLCVWIVFFFGTEVLKSQLDFGEHLPDMPLRIVAAISLFVLFKFIQFPSRTINSIELKREAGFWEYIADSFRILCWPLGIWWIQPRINRINDKKMGMGREE
ncbi:MAG TPA: hypothetical protein VIU12_10995 [Chryseolinea sp.]